MSKAHSKADFDLLQVFSKAKRAKPELSWSEEYCVGYYPVKEKDYPYNEDYMENYRSYEGQEICEKLNQFRVQLVDKFLNRNEELVDVGIGAGTFIKDRVGNTFGTDINPAGIQWLKERDIYRHPSRDMENASFWDVLEHFPDPSEPVSHVENFCFVSIPIFTSRSHILKSKHYKKDEHYWYWTEEGLIAWLSQEGFTCIHSCDTETKIGREDIQTFVFMRR